MKYLFADGNWLLHRAWHAYGKTSSAPEKRVPNQLLEWFCQGAVRMQCQGGAVCFDGPDVFRHKVYPLYKQNRSEKAIHKAGAFNDEGPSTSDRVNSLIPYTKELFVKHGIFAEQKEEFEADDLLISGAHYFTSKGADEVVFLARDKDLVQGISQRVKMFTPAMMKEPEKIWTVKSVLADKGMTPRQFLNYQIL